MPSLKTIRKRITSVKSTQKITRAMKMVAGARLNRAQMRITAIRPYALKTQEVLRSVARDAEQAQADHEAKEGPATEALHPLLVRRPERKVLYMVLSSDRGLCGGFNANVSKASVNEWKKRQAEGVEVVFGTIGRKAREYLVRRGGEITKDFLRIHDGLELSSVAQISQWFVPLYRKGEFDAVYIVYNEFKSAMTQKTVVEKLLPLPTDAELAEEGKGTVAASAGELSTQFLFEPDQKALLERLVPMYVDISIYRALLESQASEFGARMTAMDAATRNAKDMIGRLTLVYNRARQAAITKELMEIIGGAEALKD